MQKITDNSDELSFHKPTSTSSFLRIPLFQRPYVWTKRQLERMLSEIEAIANEEDVSRFLGAVIAVTRPTNPSQPTPHEIVDGQQRLTTMYIFLLAAAQIAAREGETEYARGLISTNLIVDWAQESSTNTKLQPSIGDRAQFNSIFHKVAKTGELSDWLPVKLKLPESSGNSAGPLTNQYNKISKYLKDKLKSNGFELVKELVEVVRNRLTFVFILLKDPGSASTVFEGLNDPGVPISVGDLVKNEVFARIGDDETNAKILHDNSWKPFREKFNGRFDDYFLPFSIIKKPNTTRTEMFGELRKQWEGKTSEEIIENLDEYSAPYLALTGVNDAMKVYSKDIGIRVKNLIELKQPSSTYPFLMKLLKTLEEGKISKADVIGCLNVIESFLVRRSICGIEPTGLLVMFRTMWSQCDNHPTASKIISAIKKRTTVEWPDDKRVIEAIATRPIYGTTVAKYLIVEYDRSLGVHHPEINDFSIEHVIPKSYSDEWSDVVDKTEHEKVKNLWANLLPASIAMNNIVDQSKYEVKKEYFANESMFISTREFGQKYPEWNKSTIEQRSRTLGEWAVKRWVKGEG